MLLCSKVRLNLFGDVIEGLQFQGLMGQLQQRLCTFRPLPLVGFGGEEVTWEMGFDDIASADYVEILVGKVTSCKLTSDLTGYEITVQDPQAQVNRQVFEVTSQPLIVALTDSETTGLFVADALDYGPSGYVRIDDEIIGYSGVAATGVPPAEVAWKAVAYGAGLFVAVATGGSVATSVDGLSWTPRDAAEPNDWNGICWSGSLFVAVASSGTHRVQTSSNGTSWTAQTAAAANAWDCVAAGNGLVVALSTTGSGNRAQKSTDGTTWTGPEANITGLTRGVTFAGVATVAAAHSAGATVREVIHLGPAHPMDLLEDVYTNTDKSGLSIDAAFVDSTTIAAVKASLGSSYKMEFVLDAQVNAKRWLEENIFRPLGLYPRTTGAGLLSVVEVAAPGSADDTIDHDSILANDQGAPILTWDQNLESVINSVKFEYGYNFLSGQFTASKEFTDDDSIDRYGKKPIVIQSYGLYPHLAGALAFIEARAAALLERYANGAPKVTAQVLMFKNLIEPGDILGVTSDLLPKRSTGTRGVSGELMEVINREIVFAEGVVNLTLLDTGWWA